MAKSKYTKILISPTEGKKQNSWEDLVNNNNGVLAGYAEDVSNSGIDGVLLSILKIKIKDKDNNEGKQYINWIEACFHYHYVISALLHDKAYDDEDGKKDLLKEKDTFNQDGPSADAVKIMLKYGISHADMEFFIPTSKVNNKIYKDIMFNDQEVKKEKKKQSVLSTANNESQQQEPQEVKTEEDFESYTSNPSYLKDSKQGESFKYKSSRLDVQVVIYSKTQFRAYDITNFISSVSTSVVRENGGNFEIKMHLVSLQELAQGARYQSNNLNITGYRKSLFLQSIFRENDLVYIRFEKLQSETTNKLDSNCNPIISGKDWTMIGLVDTTTVTSDATSLYINIHGRDLIKLLIEDNNLFIPYHFGNTPENMFGGNDSKVYKRLFASGEYNTMFTKSFASIESLLNFIISQLTNAQVLSDDTLSFLSQNYTKERLSNKFTISYPGVEEEELQVDGIWQLINIIVGSDIKNYKLADASLKDPSGSILQQIFKVCQKPFVEFIADTYWDKYVLFARRPPISITDICKQTFIPIGREVVLNDSLEFDREVYSVYSITPQGGCFADSNSIALAYLPWVVLDDYVKMWGNRLYSQTYNYINVDAYTKATEENQKSIKESFIDDLLWLIESTAYLPFSRKGTITIVGDRRIKVGQWIYYEKSNEVFYVDGVSNSASIQGDSVTRTTTLTVSRGLVKNYIIEPKAKGQTNIKEVSYGDLVDLSFLKEGLTELTVKMNKDFSLHRDTKNEDGTYTAQKSVVIPEVFNFFLSGKQFEGIENPYTLYYNMAALTLKELGGGKGSQGKGGHNGISGNDRGYNSSMEFKGQDIEQEQNNTQQQPEPIEQVREQRKIYDSGSFKIKARSIIIRDPERPWLKIK